MINSGRFSIDGRVTSLPDLQGHAVGITRDGLLSKGSTASILDKKLEGDGHARMDNKDNVRRALKLMRRVEIPPIRTEHDYSTRKMFGEVSNIPLQKISDIEKSAHVSLHERKMREDTLTPYQADLLAAIDKGGPRKIEEELVAKIVAEERRAIFLEKKKKRRSASGAKQAWHPDVSQPETAVVAGHRRKKSSMPQNNGNDDNNFDNDDGGSVCTTMTFSTANVSLLNEELRDMEELADHDQFSSEPPPLKSHVTKSCGFNKKVLSRTRSQVARNKDKHFREEEERKRALILSKKTRTVAKKTHSEVVIKQQIWLHLVVQFSRASVMEYQLKKFRGFNKQLHIIHLQKCAIDMISAWYKDYSLRRKMRQNAHFLTKLRMRMAVFVRRRRVKKRHEAATLLAHFIACVNGASTRTQKLYKFRGRVIKIQLVFGQFNKCQKARLKLLFLAFMRELHLARLARNHEKNLVEKVSLRSMKRTHFFGEAVQKLDTICSNLTVMMARKNASNNLKIKQFLQLQNKEDKAAGTRDWSHISRAKAPVRSQLQDEELQRQQSSSRMYEALIKRVLGNQRRRHILSQKGAEQAQTAKVVKHHAVDPAEVRRFLQTDGAVGPTYVMLDRKAIARLKHSPFLLLTGGAIRELKDIARAIVAEEDDDKMNFEIQRTLLKENDDLYFEEV